MDTRPYRLNWPTSTIIFGVSPQRLFKKSAEKLEGLYCSIKFNCLLNFDIIALLYTTNFGNLHGVDNFGCCLL